MKLYVGFDGVKLYVGFDGVKLYVGFDGVKLYVGFDGVKLYVGFDGVKLYVGFDGVQLYVGFDGVKLYVGFDGVKLYVGFGKGRFVFLGGSKCTSMWCWLFYKKKVVKQAGKHATIKSVHKNTCLVIVDERLGCWIFKGRVSVGAMR